MNWKMKKNNEPILREKKKKLQRNLEKNNDSKKQLSFEGGISLLRNSE